jgi:hypothetical protein
MQKSPLLVLAWVLVSIPSSLCALLYPSTNGGRRVPLTNFMRSPEKVSIQGVAIVDLYADKSMFNYCQLDDYT